MKLITKHMVLRNLAGPVVAALIALGTTSAQDDCSCSASYVGDMPCDAAGCSNCGDTGVGGCNGNCGGTVCNGSCGGNGCNGSCGGNGCNGSCGRGPCGADCGNPSAGRGYGQPDLFYNYYTQGWANRVNAQMYLSPGPIPPNVGHTFYTYQPLYPHHMLYWHKDRYHRYYDCGRGMNRTRAVYYSPPVRQFVSNLYWNVLRIPR